MDATCLGKWAFAAALVLTLRGWGQESAKEPQAGKPHVDLHGDPLPKGAVARLGTVRFRQPGPVCSVAFSPDGKVIAATSEGKNIVVLWDRATGRKIRELRAGRKSASCDLRFTPDGNRLYSVEVAQEMALSGWELGKEPVALDMPRPPGEARFLALAPNGRELILLHRDKEIVRWDIVRGQELGRYPKPKGEVSSALVTGDRVLVALFDRTAIRMWDATRKKELWSVKATRIKDVLDPPTVFSADGKLFAVELDIGVISVYETLTGKVVRTLEGNFGIGLSHCISPDNRTFVVWTGGWLRLWDLETGRLRCSIPANTGYVHFAFALDSKTFVVAGGGGDTLAVQIWNAVTGKLIEPFPGHARPVSSVSFAADGKRVATSLRGEPVARLWEPETGRLLRSLGNLNGDSVHAVAFSPDGGALAGCDCETVRLWDTHTGRERHTLVGHRAMCTCVAFSPDGKQLVSGDEYYKATAMPGDSLRVWSHADGKLVRKIGNTRDSIQRVLFTHDGRHILAAADGVHIYDADTGKLVGEPLQPQRSVSALALSADGQLLAAADRKGQIRLWELASRREISLMAAGVKGNDIAFAPDGRTLAVVGRKGK